MDVAAASALPGVLAILTPMNAPRLPQHGNAAVNPPAGRVLSVLQDDAVSYNLQPVAVASPTRSSARLRRRRLVRVVYAPADAAARFRRPPRRRPSHRRAPTASPTDHSRGDLVAGARRAAAKVDVVYTTPIEHHNPMEPHATIAEWDGDRLTLHDATQNVGGVRTTLARTFAIPPENVTVIDPFVGGGFGCKGSAWSHVVARGDGRQARSAGR